MASSAISTLTIETPIKQTVPDDGTFLFPYFANSARGELVIGNDEERCNFSIKADGTVNLISASANTLANTDVDGKFCVGTSVTNPVTVKNRLAGVKVVVGSIWCG
jgi:hypothetical protein